MLHIESRQGGKKDTGALIVSALAFFLFLLTGCHETTTHTKRNLTLDAFSDLKAEEYALNSQLIYESLEHICKTDTDNCFAANHTRKYYQEGGELVWTDVLGVDERADTLIEILRVKLSEMGFSDRRYQFAQIADDLSRIRTLQIDAKNSLTRVMTRLDYNLTKAYLRYVIGQRFGFVNPTYVMNHCDARERDSTGKAISYFSLYDVKVEHPDDAYVKRALKRATIDSLGASLRMVEPKGELYSRLLQLIPTSSDAQRQKILVNMERQRWRDKQQVVPDEKYIIVNVPAFHLWAVSPDSILDMRVACGALRTKTPLLSSKITHMEVNPEWVIPMSIVRDDVARHAGDSSYFARHRYYITNRKTGKRISPKAVSAGMLLSGNYRVAQEGGAGNSLGRIIFRFPNNYSVFLHDTSSPGAFMRDNRGVSHGCVRVQRPFDLAVFMMENEPDEWLLDKLRISMGMKPETEQGIEMMDELDPAEPTPRLIHSLPVSPRVPLYITYYTIFLTPDGSMQYYPDVYGYDKAVGEALKPNIE